MEQSSSQPSSSKGTASVQFGIYKQSGGFAGKTVRQIREERGKLWGIPSDASAYSGSTKLGEDDVVEEGMSVEFHRKSGEKG